MNIGNIEHANNLSRTLSENWFDIMDISTDRALTEQYADICQKHELSRKWIMMINPEDQSLVKLSESETIDTSKILKVNTNKTPVNLGDIESALSKGNCSAVVLCNPQLKNEELCQLKQSATIGRTTCIVLNNHQLVH